MSPLPTRIVIIGCCGSGKTYLARRMAERLGYSIMSLDQIVYERPEDRNPDGSLKRMRRREAGKVAEMLNDFLNNRCWVLEGIYGDLIGKALKTADLLLWTDREKNFCIQSVETRNLKMNEQYGRSLSDEQMQKVLGQIEKYADSGSSVGRARHQSLFHGFEGERRRLTSFGEVDGFLESFPAGSGLTG